MIIIDETHPTIINLDRVRPEFMYDRPLELSLRHRAWGYHMTTTDLDFMEYNGLTSEPVALIEAKHGTWNGCLSSPIKAQRRLADMAQLPYFILEWRKDFEKFTLIPINALADNWLPSGRVTFSEKEYVEFLYALRLGDHCTLTEGAWSVILNKANELSPRPEPLIPLVPPLQ